MATFHVMALPKPGESPDFSFNPLAPRDIVANSEQDALSQAQSLIDATAGEYYECLAETKGDEAAGEWIASMQLWQAHAHRVDRPPVAVEPRRWSTDVARDGGVVGTHYHYGEETGEQAFDVLIDGAVAGLLAQGGGEWQLTKTTGPLASLSGRQWPDGGVRGFVFPDAALADIRAALETRRTP